MLAEYFTRPDPNSLFDIADRTISTETGTMVEDVETLTSGPFIRLGKEFLNGWSGCSIQYGCVCGNDRKEVSIIFLIGSSNFFQIVLNSSRQVMDKICEFEEQSLRTPVTMQICHDETAIKIPGRCSLVCGEKDVESPIVENIRESSLRIIEYGKGFFCSVGRSDETSRCGQRFSGFGEDTEYT